MVVLLGIEELYFAELLSQKIQAWDCGWPSCPLERDALKRKPGDGKMSICWHCLGTQTEPGLRLDPLAFEPAVSHFSQAGLNSA